MNKNKLLLLVLKEKKIFASGIVIGILLFLIYLIFMYVPLYKTNTMVFIRNIPKQNIFADFGGESTIYSESGFSNPLFNLVQILESDIVAARIYDNLSEEYAKDFKKLGVKSKGDWLRTYKTLVSAQIKPSTDIIKISFNWANKKNADKLLDELIKEFKNVNLEIRQTVEKKQTKFLDKQLKVIANQLDNIRKKIKNFKVENRAVDLKKESSELTKARVELQKQAELLKSQVNYYDKKLADLSGQLNFRDTKTALKAVSIGEDPYLVELSQELAQSQQKYAQLKSKFTDNYPDVIAVKNEIETLEKNIAGRKTESVGDIKGIRGVYDKSSQDIIKEMALIQAEKTSTKAQLMSLRSGIEELIVQETNLPTKLMGLEGLQKEEAALAIAYENIKQKQLEARIKESEIVDNIVLINYPSDPKLVITILAMKFVGLIGMVLLLSFAVAIVKEDIENKWTDSSEVEEITGVKVLGVIPWLRDLNIIKKDSRHFIQKSDSIMGISYGEAVSNIVRSSYLHEAQAISFVSTHASRGKSIIIPNITATLARLNKSVILIVTDYDESQEIIKNFGITIPPKKLDMLDVIERVNIHLRISKTIDTKVLTQLIEEAFMPIFIDGDEMFQLLYTGKNVNIYDYVATRGFYTIIAFLKQYYEFVLIDTPVKPLIFPEFSAISSVSDGIIIVSAMETNRDGLINTINKFKNANTKILGVLVREENEELEQFFASQISINENIKPEK
ncbi:MAG: hypothetical protein AB1782_01820 [Cyanobacteriota bacterium]